MIASWMLYASVVGLLVGAAAVSADRILRAHHLPTRWVWCASLLLSIAVPVVSRFLPEDVPAPTVQNLGTPEVTGSLQQFAQVMRERTAALLLPIETLLLRGWEMGSFLLFTLVGISVFRLRRARATWREDNVDGTPILVSNDIGPAVLGVFRHRIVLPAWVLKRSDEARELILAHEREHVRAKDPLLVVASALPSLLVPWHVPLWWQYRRLRLAVEMDCDERVLRKATPGLRRRYGHLLLEVGRRKAGVLALAAPFSEERSFLGRRIRGLAETAPARPLRRAAVLSTLGMLLMTTAWVIPSPARSVGGPFPAATIEPPVPGPAVGLDAEVASPVSPLASLSVALQAAGFADRADIGPTDRAAGAEAGVAVQTVSESFALATESTEGADDPTGATPGDAVREVASEEMPLDLAPVAVGTSDGAPATGMVRPTFPQITPLVYADRPLPDASFLLEPIEVPEDEDYMAASAGTSVRPEILNADEIQKQMVRRYPPHLLDAGIGGTVVLDFFVDESGIPTVWQVVQSSGHPLLDEAALKMAGTFRFSPARTRRDQVVPVWTRFPIRFQVMR